MEGRGSGLEDWRGEAHLGSSLPVSACCCPCPLVISRVHMSWPVSAHHCPCPRIIAHVCLSFPVSARHSLCPFTFVGGRFHSWAWVVAFVRGRSSSFRGVCLRLWSMVGCGGGELLVGGGESSGLA